MRIMNVVISVYVTKTDFTAKQVNTDHNSLSLLVCIPILSSILVYLCKFSVRSSVLRDDQKLKLVHKFNTNK